MYVFFVFTNYSKNNIKQNKINKLINSIIHKINETPDPNKVCSIN